MLDNTINASKLQSFKRILHLSDLHFGRVNVPALEALRQTVEEQDKAFDLIIVTGDWTQRARPHEFDLAIDFVKGLSCPVLSVPGNHDVPLYDLGRRFFAPLSRYSKLRPITLENYRDDMMSVIGLSTVNPFRALTGLVQEDDLRRTAERFKRDEPSALRIVACHHPIYDPRTKVWIRPEQRARKLLELQPDLVLSGHSHTQWIESIDFNGRSVLHISAGTSISSRVREQVNSFHILEVRRGLAEGIRRGIDVTVKTYDLRDEGFLERGLPTREFRF